MFDKIENKVIVFKVNDIKFTLSMLNMVTKITILEACLQAGIYIPHFCYSKYLLIAGNCRICIVEIEKFIKPIISCLNLCIDNLNIYTNTFSIKKFRENVLEFLLINHPLDCPICDQAGECDLQEQTIYYGLDKSRFFLKKKVNSDILLNNYIKLILNRCILCLRCVRFLRETNINSLNSNMLGVVGRGSSSKIHLFSNNLKILALGSGNIIDICPVGALTLKLNQFISRPWELRSIINFDIFDSFGLPIKIDYKNSEIVRILPYLDAIFYLEFISDITRFKFNDYNKWYYLLNNSDQNLNIDMLWSKYRLKNLKRFIIYNFLT
jgi:NADH dehydrogenase/NADH:ubiquinone oxidoreductase subunit G